MREGDPRPELLEVMALFDVVVESSKLGVRKPELRFAFLEGGVAWGAQLYADLLGHYEKRNRDAVQQLSSQALQTQAGFFTLGKILQALLQSGNAHRIAGQGLDQPEPG